LSTIGFFGIDKQGFGNQHDRAYLPKLGEMVGAHAVKVALSEDGVEYFNVFASKVKAAKLDSAIVTDQRLLTLILKSLPDYKQAYNKNGSEKKLSLNDYHGSLIEIDGFRVGREAPLEVLFLNPLEHLRTVPEAPYIFKRFISKLTKPESWFPQTQFTWEVANEDTVAGLYTLFQSSLLIAADIETDEGSPLRTINCSGYCALFADGTSHSVVIPTTSIWGVEWMRRFNSLKAPKCFQNGLYDNAYYARYNAPAFNWLYDTQHLFHSWYSELPKRLDYITAFSIRKVRYWKDDGKTGGSLSHYEYNARDCWATLNSCLSLLNEMPGWAKTNYLEEFPLVFPCLHVELDGMQVDAAEFAKSREDVIERLRPHETNLAAWLGKDFNPRSPDQTKRLLKVLGAADKHGNVESSDEPALNAAAAIHPLNALILNEILEVRGLRKLRDTYLVWEKMWHDRLFCKLNPAGTDTGRMACSESSFWCGLSLQTIPARDGSAVRRFIKADDGWLLGENDMPQSEARCVGYISGCTSLIDLVEGPHDYHSWNAQSFFGIPYSEIYNEELKITLNKPIRNLSKRTNHGANYNMGAAVMLQTMGPKLVAEAKSTLKLPAKMTLIEVCAHLLEAYARTYPEVKVDYQEWIKRIISITKKLVSAHGGTRYFFSDPRSSKPALNAAVAHVPQNLSAVIVNRGFYKVWRESVYGEVRGRLRVKAPIHDSILYGYKGKDVPYLVKDWMTFDTPVTDIKGVQRIMTIHPDVSAKPGAVFWSDLK
jgi:hypothetical protein